MFLRRTLFHTTLARDRAASLFHTLIGSDDAGLLVATADRIVSVSTVQPEGKKVMTAADYLRGRAEPTPRVFDAEA